MIGKPLTKVQLRIILGGVDDNQSCYKACGTTPNTVECTSDKNVCAVDSVNPPKWISCDNILYQCPS